MSPVYKLFIPIIIVLMVAVVIFLKHWEPQTSQHPSSESEVAYDDDGDEDASGHSTVEVMAGKLVVHIPEAIQQDADLQLLRLKQAQRNSELHAFAQLVDIQSLLDLKARYSEALTEKKIGETALQVTGMEFERLKLLRSEASNISERELQQSRLQWMSSQTQLQAAQVKLENVRNQLLQGWGLVLTEQVLNENGIAGDLLERKSVLLLVTLEGSQLLPANTGNILINVQGNREQSQSAYYISPASFTDGQIYGQTYFFHTLAADLRKGVYLDAWIPEGNENSSGVYIPPAAVIWYADKPWVYIKTGTDTFVRTELEEYTVTRDGWFVRKNFREGDEIVLYGAQMLLSEEFRWSIPDEDDNP